MVRSYNGNKDLSVLALLLLFVREIDMRFYIERNAIMASVFNHLLMKTFPNHLVGSIRDSFYCLLHSCNDRLALM